MINVFLFSVQRDDPPLILPFPPYTTPLIFSKLHWTTLSGCPSVLTHSLYEKEEGLNFPFTYRAEKYPRGVLSCVFLGLRTSSLTSWNSFIIKVVEFFTPVGLFTRLGLLGGKTNGFLLKIPIFNLDRKKLVSYVKLLLKHFRSYPSEDIK